MKVFGFELSRTSKASVAAMGAENSAALMPARGSNIFGFIQESFAGAWQRNIRVEANQSLLAFSAVYACVSLIANDVGKLCLKLMTKDDTGIEVEVESGSPFLPVLTRPNHFQNRMQFLVSWIISKLLYGNTYVLKERDNRGVVVALYILDPRLVTPLVATNGDVFYQLNSDPLSLVPVPLTAVPASEVIHDRCPTLWHPLLGVSPIYACGSSATQGIRIQANSALFFQNMSRPSGVLTAPKHIPDDTAERLKTAFEENFSGDKIGRLAVLGDGLTYVPLSVPASDAQLIEQLKWTVEDVARCFHVPLHMIGSGPNPTYQNIGALTQAYYSQTLQTHIEGIELCLTEGLELPSKYEVELDLDELLRMDMAARFDAWAKAIGCGLMAPNEARQRENLPPVAGGDTPYLQQQNWSLAQLDKRDINAASAPAPAPAPAADPNADPNPTEPAQPPAPPTNAGIDGLLLAAKLIATFSKAEVTYADY